MISVSVRACNRYANTKPARQGAMPVMVGSLQSLCVGPRECLRNTTVGSLLPPATIDLSE